MFFSRNLVGAFVSAIALIPSALALAVTSPNSNAYWVYGISNTISWTYTSGDPTTISIFITNPDSDALNGPFAVAENVPISQQSVTVTQVTLRPDDGYIVNFVDAKNDTAIFAQSTGFTVKPQGSLPYGEVIIVSSSFTTSGGLTLAFPITEISSSGATFATGFVTTGSSAATSASEAPAGPATATIITKPQGSSAAPRSFSIGSCLAAGMFAVVGGLIGAIAVL